MIPWFIILTIFVMLIIIFMTIVIILYCKMNPALPPRLILYVFILPPLVYDSLSYFSCDTYHRSHSYIG